MNRARHKAGQGLSTAREPALFGTETALPGQALTRAAWSAAVPATVARDAVGPEDPLSWVPRAHPLVGDHNR